MGARENPRHSLFPRRGIKAELQRGLLDSGVGAGGGSHPHPALSLKPEGERGDSDMCGFFTRGLGGEAGGLGGEAGCHPHPGLLPQVRRGEAATLALVRASGTAAG